MANEKLQAEAEKAEAEKRAALVKRLADEQRLFDNFMISAVSSMGLNQPSGQQAQNAAEAAVRIAESCLASRNARQARVLKDAGLAP